MSGLGYNICATPQMIEIIHLSGVTAEARGRWRDKQATKTGTSGRLAPARLPGRGKARQGLAKDTKKEPNSTGSKQSGISPCFHAPGILTTRKPGSPPQRLRRSASLNTRQ